MQNFTEKEMIKIKFYVEYDNFPSSSIKLGDMVSGDHLFFIIIFYIEIYIVS